MINVLLTCDDTDSSLGEFFRKCFDRTLEILNNAESNTVELKGNKLNTLSIELKTNLFNKKPFLFLSFCHGSKTGLFSNGFIPFLSTENNLASLQNSFSYCFACRAGSELGHEICQNGALSFIGYAEDVTIQRLFGAQDSFVNTAVNGIESFINGNTIGHVIIDMKENYDRIIDEYYIKDMITASIFMQNRDALVAHGNLNLSILDFELD